MYQEEPGINYMSETSEQIPYIHNWNCEQRKISDTSIPVIDLENEDYEVPSTAKNGNVEDDDISISDVFPSSSKIPLRKRKKFETIYSNRSPAKSPLREAKKFKAENGSSSDQNSSPNVTSKDEGQTLHASSKKKSRRKQKSVGSKEVSKKDKIVHALVNEEMKGENKESSSKPSSSKKSLKKNKSEYHKESEEDFEKKKDYRTLVELDDLDLVPNVEEFECPICFVKIVFYDGVVLKECLHSFCKDCLGRAIQYSDTALIKCPFQNDEYSCESHLQEREIKCIVTPEVYERHLQRSLALAESEALDSFHCKTPDCPGWCLFEDNVNTFFCPVCKTTNCLACAAIHEGRDCKQYQDYVAFSCDTNEEAKKTEEYLDSNYHKSWKEDFEKKKDYRTLVALNDVNLVPNVENFECPICFVEVLSNEGVVLKECLHSFCKDCLRRAVQYSDTALIKCPFGNEEYSCESHLQEREIKCIVTPKVYERHLQKSLALAESEALDSFHCKTPDCPGWCLFEDNVNTFFCLVCKRTNCLTCAAIHEGRNCKQYQDDIAFSCDTNEEAKKTKKYLDKMVKKGKAMKCPRCLVILMKQSGCDYLRCSMCRTDVCWVTKGPRWGPAGYGDTSGGCKCMLNGVLCHPKCGNCH